MQRALQWASLSLWPPLLTLSGVAHMMDCGVCAMGCEVCTPLVVLETVRGARGLCQVSDRDPSVMYASTTMH